MGRKCQSSVAHCQDNGRGKPYFPYMEENIDLQIKVFRWPNQANHLIMLARGIMDLEGFKQMFCKVLRHEQAANRLQGTDRPIRRQMQT